MPRAGNPLVDIQKIILGQTQTIGPVGNLHGVAAVSQLESDGARTQQWSIARIPATRMLSLYEAAEAYSFERSGVEFADGDDQGVLRYPRNGTVKGALLFHTFVHLDAPRSVPLRIEGASYQIDVYVDQGRVASRHDVLSTSISIGAGTHLLAFVLYGGTETVQIQVVRDLECLRGDVTPAAPIWVGGPALFQLDAEKGVLLSRLEWKNDPFASSWNVYRAETTSLGAMTNVTDLGSGEFQIRLSGALSLSVGEEAYTRYWRAGTVQELSSGTDAGGDYTLVTLFVDPDASSDVGVWEGVEYLQPGNYESVAHLAHAGNSTLRWDDNRIKPKQVYTYKLTALGLFGEIESDFSTPQLLYTDDDSAPQGIDWNAAAPPKVTVEGEMVTVQFCAPPDPDLTGVRVYGPYPFDDPLNPAVNPPLAFTPDYLVASALATPSAADASAYNAQISFRVAKDGTGTPIDGNYFLPTFDATGNEQPSEDTVDETTGDPIPGAYGFVFDGPGIIKYAQSISIEFDILPDASEPDRIQTLSLKVYPKAASLSGWVNGDVADGTSAPLLSVYDDTQETYTEYRITLTRVEESYTRFIATATGPGLPPQSFEYSMDPDTVPGVSGVHVEDRKSQPIVYAVMDDDAQWLRFLRTPFDPVNDLLFTATRTAGTDVAGTIDYNTAILVYTYPDVLTTDDTVEVRIDASRDGTNWTTDVWHGTVQGPPGAGPAGPAGKDAIVGVLSNEFQGIPTDSQGNNGNYTGASSTMYVFIGSVDDSANWTVTATPSAGVTGSLAGKTYTVTNLTVDSGYVDFTASRSGYSSVTARFTLSKVKSGADGVDGSPGAPGDDSTSYTLVPGVAAIKRAVDGSYTPASLSISATSQTGISTPIAYAGRFKIWETTNGTTYTIQYTSAANESSKTYTPSAGIKAVKVELYLAGGTTTLLDQQIIPVVEDGPPGVSACSIQLTTTVSEPTTTVHLAAYPTTAAVSATLNGASLGPATTPALTDLGGGAYQVVLTRSPFLDQRLVVQATANGYAAGSATYSIDRDPTPGFSNVSAPIPLYSGSTQNGWQVNGSADDDAKQVAISLTGGLTLRSSVPTASGSTLDVSTAKTFSILLDQAAGGLGSIQLTPQDGATAGNAWIMNLALPPVTTITPSEITSTIRRITLQTSPATAKIYATVRGADGTPGKTYTTPLVNDTSAPASPTPTAGALTFFVNLADLGQALIIEYYATTPSATEEKKQQRIDADRAPEITLSTTGSENVLSVTATPDDDMVRWKLWAKLGSVPTTNGQTTGTPDNKYLYFEGGVHDRLVSWWANAGTWNLLAYAYDKAGRYTITTKQQTVTAAASTDPALSNATITRQDNATGNDYHVLSWSHNAPITSTSGHVAKVLENGVAKTSVGAYLNTAQVVTPEQKLAGNAGAVYRRYEYTLQLLDSGGSVISSYPLVIDGYYDDGTVSPAAPTEVPGTPFLTWTGGAHPAKATWTNTSDVWAIEVNWFVNGLGSTQLLAPGITTTSIPVASGDQVQMKLRYYNDGGNGLWSAMSNTVTITGGTV